MLPLRNALEVQRRPAMRKNITETPKKNRQSRSQLSGNLTVGIDLGDRSSRYCILNQEGEVVAASAVATTKKDLSRVFGTLRPSRLALEVGRTRRG